MERQSTEDRAAEIQERVEAWVRREASAAEAKGSVAAEATATRSVAVPAAPGETVPEEWTVAVRLRFAGAGADDAEARRLLHAFSGATTTVTLESREAAELTWPDTSDTAPAADGDDLVCDLTVDFQVPWPHEGEDASAPAI